MKQYTITRHPFKITIEFDDQWLVRFDIGEPEMQEIADGLDEVLKKESCNPSRPRRPTRRLPRI